MYELETHVAFEKNADLSVPSGTRVLTFTAVKPTIIRRLVLQATTQTGLRAGSEFKLVCYRLLTAATEDVGSDVLTTTVQPRGHGVSLAVAHNLTLAMGDTLHVQSIKPSPGAQTVGNVFLYYSEKNFGGDATRNFTEQV